MVSIISKTSESLTSCHASSLESSERTSSTVDAVKLHPVVSTHAPSSFVFQAIATRKAFIGSEKLARASALASSRAR